MNDQIDIPEEDYLYVNISQLPNSGKGLYTAIPIYKDEIISYFKGEILSSAEAKSRAEKKLDQYFINLLDGRIMDSKNIECMAKYANDAQGSSRSDFKNNAKISLDENDLVCLIATKNIKADEEIFCSYGKKYWEKHGPVC
jgi:SET domain-containing protein